MHIRFSGSACKDFEKIKKDEGHEHYDVWIIYDDYRKENEKDEEEKEG